MGDRTVTFRPMPGRSYDIVGSDTDAGVLLSIENHDGAYAEGVARLLADRVPEDGVVADVGANIGVLTVLLADVASRGRVVAFEPAPENLDYLHRNVARATNVEVVAAAVGASDGELRFDVNPDYPAGAHVAEDGALRVPCRSLDSWVAERGLDRLDALKIDVEGAEPDVLSGAAETIRRFTPVIVLECNAGSLRRIAGASFSQLLDQLRSLVPHVGILLDNGDVVPVLSNEHLELAMGQTGIVDLVGQWKRPGARSLLRARRHLADARHLVAGDAPPDPHNFVVTAPIAIDVDPVSPRARAGETVTLDVTVHNTSRWWLSPSFTWHPVNVAARWVGGAEAGRAFFAAPVAPGATASCAFRLEIPDDMQAGTHELEVTLVQEAFAWLADLDPRCSRRVSVTVTVEPPPQ